MLANARSSKKSFASRRVKLCCVVLILAVVTIAAWLALTRRSGVPVGSLISSSKSEAVSRDEVIAIARSYAEHRWQATASNIRHGPDSHGIDIQTPDAPAGDTAPGKWHATTTNTGMPYKWGGFDTPASFDAGLRAGKAAGDVYSYAKRRAGNAAVSTEAVGIDCSGFISRCWRLPEKFGTATPSGAPVPNFSGWRDTAFSMP